MAERQRKIAVQRNEDSSVDQKEEEIQHDRVDVKQVSPHFMHVTKPHRLYQDKLKFAAFLGLLSLSQINN